MKCHCEECGNCTIEVVNGYYHSMCEKTQSEWGDEERYVEDCKDYDKPDGSCFRG